jgi:hypothetical protein
MLDREAGNRPGQTSDRGDSMFMTASRFLALALPVVLAGCAAVGPGQRAGDGRDEEIVYVFTS